MRPPGREAHAKRYTSCIRTTRRNCVNINWGKNSRKKTEKTNGKLRFVENGSFAVTSVSATAFAGTEDPDEDPDAACYLS